MVVNQKIIASINEQIGNEFSSDAAVLRHLQLILVRKRCPSYPPISTIRPREEKKHALRFIEFLFDAGAYVNIPTVPTPLAHFNARRRYGNFRSNKRSG